MYINDAPSCSVSHRSYSDPTLRDTILGLRLAL